VGNKKSAFVVLQDEEESFFIVLKNRLFEKKLYTSILVFIHENLFGLCETF